MARKIDGALAKFACSRGSGWHDKRKMWHHEVQERVEQSSGIVQREDPLVNNIAGLHIWQTVALRRLSQKLVDSFLQLFKASGWGQPTATASTKDLNLRLLSRPFLSYSSWSEITRLFSRRQLQDPVSRPLSLNIQTRLDEGPTGRRWASLESVSSGSWPWRRSGTF